MRRRLGKAYYKGNEVSLSRLKEGVGHVYSRAAMMNPVDEPNGRTVPADRRSR